MFKNELEIDVLRCLTALLKKLKIIVMVSVLLFFVGFGVSVGENKDMYSATATAYAAAENSYMDAANAVTAMNAYLDVAKSYKVCQRAALIIGRGNINPTDIQSSVFVGTSAKTKANTSFMNSSATIISFTATTDDPELSKEMADAMVLSYTKEMSDILHSDSVKTLDTAYEAYKSYNYKIELAKNGIKAMLLGFAIACFVVVACEIFDPKVRTIREATIRDSIPVIGVIPDYKE